MGIRDVAFSTPRVMLLHWQQCAPFQSHLLAFLPSFILWQVWKVRNAFRFNSSSFFVDAIIYQVVVNLRLANSAFGFKPSQLKEFLGSWIAEGLRVIAPPKRLIRLVS